MVSRDKAREIGYGRAMGMEQVSRKDLVDLAEHILGENSRLQAEVERLSQRVAELEAELATREPAAPRPPAWIKPNKPTRSKEKGERKKRRAQTKRSPGSGGRARGGALS